ncbi:LysR family transcriptional regulator of gallate degradation [Amorphus suaedae]
MAADVHRVNLRHLRLLDAAARAGTVHGAASATGLTQPAVSQAITRLEAIFGARLLVRGRNGARLTEEGALVVLRVRRILELLRRMQVRVDTGRRRGAAVLARVVTFSQLEVLLAIDKAGGFSGAAAALHVAQPTVHRAARQFERLIGHDLFRSDGFGITVTPLARDLARLAGLAFKEIEMAFADVDGLHGLRHGRLVIGSLPLIRADLLPAAITELCRRYPGCSIDVTELDYESLVDRLKRGDIDMIIGRLRGHPEGSDLAERPLLRDSLAVIARKGHPLSGRADLRTDDLRRYPWVMTRAGTPIRHHFDVLFGEELPDFGLIECSSLSILRALLVQSDRLALLSRRQITFEAELGLLAALPMVLPETSREIGVTTRRDWKPAPLQAAFLTIIEEVARTGTADVSSAVSASL